MSLWTIYSNFVTWEIIYEINQASKVFQKTCQDLPTRKGKENEYINGPFSNFLSDALKTELQKSSLVSSES